MIEPKQFADAAHLAQPSDGTTLLPPTAIDAAVALGKSWAESIVARRLRAKGIDTWPRWPPFDEAPKRSRTHAAKLVAPIHVDVAHPRHAKELREPDAVARRLRAREALVRLCYETAQTRFAELAAWRLR